MQQPASANHSQPIGRQAGITFKSVAKGAATGAAIGFFQGSSPAQSINRYCHNEGASCGHVVVKLSHDGPGSWRSDVPEPRGSLSATICGYAHSLPCVHALLVAAPAAAQVKGPVAPAITPEQTALSESLASKFDESPPKKNGRLRCSSNRPIGGIIQRSFNVFTNYL